MKARYSESWTVFIVDATISIDIHYNNILFTKLNVPCGGFDQ